jgi:hypothetical protein
MNRSCKQVEEYGVREVTVGDPYIKRCKLYSVKF